MTRVQGWQFVVSKAATLADTIAYIGPNDEFVSMTSSGLAAGLLCVYQRQGEIDDTLVRMMMRGFDGPLV